MRSSMSMSMSMSRGEGIAILSANVNGSGNVMKLEKAAAMVNGNVVAMAKVRLVTATCMNSMVMKARERVMSGAVARHACARTHGVDEGVVVAASVC